MTVHGPKTTRSRIAATLALGALAAPVAIATAPLVSAGAKTPGRRRRSTREGQADDRRGRRPHPDHRQPFPQARDGARLPRLHQAAAHVPRVESRHLQRADHDSSSVSAKRHTLTIRLGKDAPTPEDHCHVSGGGGGGGGGGGNQSTPPNPPTSLAASAADGSVSLTWSAGTGGSAVTGYRSIAGSRAAATRRRRPRSCRTRPAATPMPR